MSESFSYNRTLKPYLRAKTEEVFEKVFEEITGEIHILKMKVLHVISSFDKDVFRYPKKMNDLCLSIEKECRKDGLVELLTPYQQKSLNDFRKRIRNFIDIILQAESPEEQEILMSYDPDFLEVINNNTLIEFDESTQLDDGMSRLTERIETYYENLHTITNTVIIVESLRREMRSVQTNNAVYKLYYYVYSLLKNRQMIPNISAFKDNLESFLMDSPLWKGQEQLDNNFLQNQELLRGFQEAIVSIQEKVSYFIDPVSESVPMNFIPQKDLFIPEELESICVMPKEKGIGLCGPIARALLAANLDESTPETYKRVSRNMFGQSLRADRLMYVFEREMFSKGMEVAEKEYHYNTSQIAFFNDPDFLHLRRMGTSLDQCIVTQSGLYYTPDCGRDLIRGSVSPGTHPLTQNGSDYYGFNKRFYFAPHVIASMVQHVIEGTAQSFTFPYFQTQIPLGIQWNILYNKFYTHGNENHIKILKGIAEAMNQSFPEETVESFLDRMSLENEFTKQSPELLRHCSNDAFMQHSLKQLQHVLLLWIEMKLGKSEAVMKDFSLQKASLEDMDESDNVEILIHRDKV